MTYRWHRLLGALRHPFTEYQVTKAKNAHRKEHPHCFACECERDPVTGKKNDVHHLMPVHVRPDLATDPGNLVTLCRSHHYWWGHGKDWRHYNSSCLDTCRRVKQVWRRVQEAGWIVEDEH